jgi:hypothetical protein
MNIIWTGNPEREFVHTCKYCGTVFSFTQKEIDDYFDLLLGYRICCPVCEKTLYLANDYFKNIK